MHKSKLLAKNAFPSKFYKNIIMKATLCIYLFYFIFLSVSVYLFPQKDQIVITLLKQNCVLKKVVIYEKYLVQMLEVLSW